MKYVEEIHDETAFGVLTWKERMLLWILLAFDLLCVYGVFLLIDKLYRILISV